MKGTKGAQETKGYLTIGRVVERLKERYPDLSISKVRYLEEEGLLSPERTGGGYRKFSPRDIQRLEIIMRLQGEHFLPLSVIKRKLADLDSGKVPVELEGGGAGEVLRLPLGETAVTSAEQAVAATGLSAATIKELESFGVVKSRQTGEGRVYDSIDIEILKTCKRLAQFGIEPRHLRMYSTFAERESAFFSQIVLPGMHHHQEPETEARERKRIVTVLEELSQGTQQLHSLLLRRALRDEFGNA